MDDTKPMNESVLSLLLSFSSSSLTSSHGSPDFSCEDLNESFLSHDSFTTVDTTNDDEIQRVHPSPETILFFEMLQEFPDLKTFVCHPDFMTFATLWLGYKHKTMLARIIDQRPSILSWFKSTTAQIHYQLITIAKSGNRTDPEALGMFSAFRRLKDRMEIVLQILAIIENGRVLFGQSALEAVAPLAQIALDIKRQVAMFAQDPHVVPFLNQGRVELRSIHQVTMRELSNRVLQTYQFPSETSALLHNTIRHRDIQPYLLHSWSLPTTPSCIEYHPIHQEQFFSLPTSPKGSSMSLSEEEESEISSIHSEDDDYVVSEDEEEANKAVTNKQRKVANNRRKKKTATNKFRTEKHHATTRRTATSYDAQTTHYLKTIFFDIYSHREKLTKDQRRQIQKKTGLKPRNITYWFSNHKRRFQNSLAVFKQVVKESQGKVKTYDDFLAWRKEKGLPEEILEEELANLKLI